MKFKKIINWLVVLGIVGGAGGWLFKEITKPLPGQEMGDMGREHVTDISEVKYNSNPPTSGPHFPMWAKPGVYGQLISDGYFIHSMEHGYIILWYSCSNESPVPLPSEQTIPLMKMTAQPTNMMSWVTTESLPKEEIKLPESFNSESCKTLVSNLSELTNVAERVIVTPRVGMDTQIAATAWRRIEKFDSFDKEGITNFIETYHNHGPEQTME